MNLQNAQLFFGDINSAEARCYVRVPAHAASGELQGYISGPRCVYSSTLQARIPLRVTRHADELVLQAVVPDPCFWTPELPFLYDVEISAATGGEGDEPFRGVLGFRPLAPLRGSLRYAGQIWVLRCASRASVMETPLDQWHAHGLAMLVPAPNDELCRMASELGVLLVAKIDLAGSELQRELARLARWPAVALAVLSGAAPQDIDVRTLAPNLLLIPDSSAATASSQPGYLRLIETADESLLAEELATGQRAVLVRRDVGAPVTIEAARQACDLLQRDIAQLLVRAGVEQRPAGYIV